MSSVFSRIIAGELPARFVWSDPRCVAFLTSAPIRPGHVLVVPRAEVAHWLDLDAAELAHVTGVAQQIGRALQRAYGPARVGMMIAGLEVAHVHLHLLPIDEPTDLEFARADAEPDPADLDADAERIRGALRALGASGVRD